MLSFFLKKKQSPDATIDDINQAPNNGVDDFIFIEKKTNGDPTPQPVSHSIYPPTPSSHSGMPYPMIPYPPQRSQSIVPVVPYVQDVPFVLAPQLLIKNTSDFTQTQVDGVLALLTRQMSVDGKDDYSFALEKSIQNECY